MTCATLIPKLVLDKDVAKEKYRLRGGEETEILSSGTKKTKPERRRGGGGGVEVEQGD